MAFIDAPVSGGVKGAEAGTLTIMAGGDEAAIARVEPLFGMMGQRVFQTGALGSGQAMKALNNLVSAGALILTIEALLVGQRAGLDPALMTEILNVSTGRSNATDQKILPYVLSRRFDSGFALQLMAKDLATAKQARAPNRDASGFERTERKPSWRLRSPHSAPRPITLRSRSSSRPRSGEVLTKIDAG